MPNIINNYDVQPYLRIESRKTAKNRSRVLTIICILLSSLSTLLEFFYLETVHFSAYEALNIRSHEDQNKVLHTF